MLSLTWARWLITGVKLIAKVGHRLSCELA
jgi:hypothetical protein